MNSSDRIRAVLRSHQTDRTPVTPEMIAVTATLCDVPVIEYVKSGDVISQCQIEAARIVNSDVLFAIADLCIEAEAIGCKLVFPENNYPHIKTRVITGPSDLKTKKIPDPYSDGRMPEIIKAVRLLKKDADGSRPVVANVIGPLTLASRIMDIEKMLYMIVDHPDQFKSILEFCFKVSSTFAKALVREGADGIIIFDPAASPSVMPEKLFNQFEAELVKIIFSAVKDINQDILTWYSVAGPLQNNLSIITSVSAEITTVDYPTPMKTMIDYMGYTVVNGNIKPGMFLEGSKDDVYREARTLLKTTEETKRFILGSGCEIPLFSKEENIKALFLAVMDERQEKDNLS
ncbi:hypothetical protein MNBD_NITROSPINAE04-514 [hydrothermal vent metagenome]|uniref:Uroporphyrinogen decarboxylase (URO-D) domain-containing protein n=1 Tax=hydrothermal vent metagenome TaxID=652676 RepID=A0A3B1CDG2_9ZZZZ